MSSKKVTHLKQPATDVSEWRSEDTILLIVI